MDGTVREAQDGVTSLARKKPRSSRTGSSSGAGGGCPRWHRPPPTARGARGERAGVLEPLPGSPGAAGVADTHLHEAVTLGHEMPPGDLLELLTEVGDAGGL